MKKNILSIFLCLVMIATVFAVAVPMNVAAEPGEPIEEWAAIYDGPGIVYGDAAYALAVDSSGNVYVTGASYGGYYTSDYDYATIKYDTDGNQLWVKRYNGPGNSDDRANAIAVDSSGNVYVTGRSRGSGTWYDYATIKYDTDGNQLWVKRYTSYSDRWDSAKAIALDSQSNVYVTGWSANDYATIKYDGLTGNPMWIGNPGIDVNGAARYNGPGNDYDYAESIALDSSGNVYVTGQSRGSGTRYDYATVKYNGATGNQLWVARYNGLENSDDEANAIAVDTSGNAYVTGRSWGSGTGIDYATIKYDTDGNQLWEARYNGPINGYDMANAIAVDSSGNVYVTGRSYGSIGSYTKTYDYATIKYDTDGNQLWEARYNWGTGHDYANAIAVDLSGNVYVTGNSAYDFGTVKYAPSGNELWVARYNTYGSEGAESIAVDRAGNIYVTGWGRGDYTTIKYSQASPVVEVLIDIKPGGDQNAINLGSQGVIPIAILSTLDFDATQVNPDTVSLAGAGVAVKGKGSKLLSSVEDVNGDGLMDLLLKVVTSNLDPGEFQDGWATLTGEMYDGTLIEGKDTVNIVPS